MTNSCAMSTWIFSSTILLSSFLLDFGRKHFGGPEEKTLEPHQFSLLYSLQPNIEKNNFLSTFLSFIFHPPKISQTKQTLNVTMINGGW